MQQEIRFATFNVLNLALPGLRFYDGIEPYTHEQYAAKVAWLARKFDHLDADVIGAQSVGIAPVLIDRRDRFTEADVPAGVPLIRSLEELLPIVDARLDERASA